MMIAVNMTVLLSPGHLALAIPSCFSVIALWCLSEYGYIPLITGKNPSVLRTLTANRNTNPNPTNPMDSRITYPNPNPNPTNPITLLTLWIFSCD